MEHADTLLGRPAARVGRLVARDYLRRWTKARERLDAPDDPEALHDFRVELRRLRSVLRAFRPQREARISGRTWRRLRRLADATSESRNLQVERGWVEQQLEWLGPEEQGGARWLLARLEERQRMAEQRVERRVRRWFAPLRWRLRQGLAERNAAAASPKSGRSITTGVLVQRTVRQWSAELEDHLAAIHAGSDLQSAHGARIIAKRLRYLLEPFEQALPDGPAIIEQLTALQGTLGRLQDVHVLGDELREALADIAAQRARQTADQLLGRCGRVAPDATGPTVEAGLLALAGRLREEADQAFEALRTGWLEGRAASLLAQLKDVGRGYRAKPRRAGPARGALLAVELPSLRLGLGQLGHSRLREQQHAGDGDGVLQREADDLGRVDDARLDQVHIPA